MVTLWSTLGFLLVLFQGQ
uniref:Uncharacterized protein n=1 Tax=Rhizophora mucronata TaxID=61149 RepID=A0A2P2NRR4_RHIMU